MSDEYYDEDDFLEEEDWDEEDEADLPERLELVEAYLERQAAAEASAQQAQSARDYDVWEDQKTLGLVAQELQLIEGQIGRKLSGREQERFVDHFATTGQGPFDAAGSIIKDPDLSTAEGRRTYMAERLEENGESEPHSFKQGDDGPIEISAPSGYGEADE